MQNDELKDGDRLLKSGVNMGIYRARIGKFSSPDKLIIQQALIENEELVANFNNKPLETIHSILSSYSSKKDPRTSPTLGGGKFANIK